MRSFFPEAFNYSVQTTFFTLANNNEKLRPKYLLAKFTVAKAPCVPMSIVNPIGKSTLLH